VPGEPAGTGFKQLGEALSFDGRFVAFWGSWGEQTRWVTRGCPMDGSGVSRVQVAYKGRKTGLPQVDGTYQSLAAHSAQPIRTLAETGMPGMLLDPYAPADALVTTVGLEREGLRKQWLAIKVSMLDPQTSEAWAGVCLTLSRQLGGGQSAGPAAHGAMRRST
jgi:hypothetical protein